ncbi:MAG: TrkH family potassium uptake protein [Bacteroidota bacterium]|nr:TrkH family potassium uptake protein [Bacteroidota bacterium]
MRFNYKVIGAFLGLLIMINGFFMLTCLPISYYFGEGDEWPLFLSSIIALGSGFAAWMYCRNSKDKELKKRDGYIVVTLGWLSMSLFGSLPYILSGSIPDYTNAFFETISGYSTTGATIITDIEIMPRGILFWRSLTQWIGGMGIIVLTVAILPMLGIGGMQLFVAEAPGITPDKIQPRIKETAKRLWLIYLGFTIAESLLLILAGMNVYDAVNHSLTTTSTGGFSTKNASIAHYESPLIQYIIIFFMMLSGVNFTLSYFALKGKFKKITGNEEFKNYLKLIVILSVIIGLVIFSITGTTFEKSFRDALFQVVSIITTTGYVTADYTSWSPFITIIFFILLFAGGSAGSTAGGVKIVRHVILFKNSILELKRQLHPSAVIPVRLNGKAVKQEITFNVLAFIMIYIMIFALGSVLMAMIGVDFITAMGSVATSLGNIGPGVGAVGPLDNFSEIPAAGKWLLSFLMLLGRLELFTVLILFTPYFWSRQ